MSFNKIFYIQFIAVFSIHKISANCYITRNSPDRYFGLPCEVQTDGLFSENETDRDKPILSINFGHGQKSYLNKTPEDFNFSTEYLQVLPKNMNPGKFSFVTKMPAKMGHAWHMDTLDHTNNSQDGYIYIIDGGKIGSQIFNTTIDHLCTGRQYEFSAYIANLVKNIQNAPKPNIRFEVRTASSENHLIAQKDTGCIQDSSEIVWNRYGLSFMTYTTSIVLLMILNTGDHEGNDFAIDDIELRSYHSNQLNSIASVSYLIPRKCKNTSKIGFNCCIPMNLCDTLNPCQNNATCTFNQTNYSCKCLPSFSGTRCQFDHRPCKLHNCSNHGICSSTSNQNFNCTCNLGWEGTYCELKVNFCKNNTCQNRGICRSLFRNFTCECLGDHYFGRYCEHTAKKIFILQIISKLFAYVSILAMSSVVLFVIIMDVLKYGFGIDRVEGEREKLRREKRAKKHRLVIQRFTYVA